MSAKSALTLNLSPAMSRALDLLREHGELLRWDDSRSWSPRGQRPADRNWVDTATIKALKGRQMVQVDSDGMSREELVTYFGPVDQRATLTGEGEYFLGIGEEEDG